MFIAALGASRRRALITLHRTAAARLTSHAAARAPHTFIASDGTHWRMSSPTNAASNLTLGDTAIDVTGARAMSTGNFTREASPFLHGKKHDSATPAAPLASSSTQATPTTPLPNHIHSKTCGCPSHDITTAVEADTGADQAFLSQADLDALSPKDPHMALANGEPFDVKKHLHSLLNHNHRFVMEKAYEPYLTDRYPYKKLVVVTCMDTRLTELLPVALDLKNGDAKVIKVAGAMVAHPFGSVMRSILVAVYALGAEHVFVVGHHDCGMTGMDPNKVLNQAKARGVPESTFNTLKAAGLDLNTWLSGFDNVRSSVLHSVDTIKNHPLLNFTETSIKTSEAAEVGINPSVGTASPNTVGRKRMPRITVTGFVICPTTGKLDLVTPADPDTQDLIEQHEKELEKAKAQAKA